MVAVDAYQAYRHESNEYHHFDSDRCGLMPGLTALTRLSVTFLNTLKRERQASECSASAVCATRSAHTTASSWPSSCWWSSNHLHQHTSFITQALDVPLHGPTREDAACASRVKSADTEDDVWMYELQLAQSLPAVDVSGTPLSKMMTPSRYQHVVRAMHKVISVLVRLNRLNILVFGSIIFLPLAVTRPWIPLLGAISLFPPLSFSLFFSVEILALLKKNYEFWFISILNVINWVGIANIFGDFRAVVCLSFWLNSQNIISIDANYRTYQTTVKSIVMAGPSMLALVFCCSYRLIVDSTYPSFSIGTVTLQWRQIVIFSASTLIIFMFKKAYAKIRRRRRRVQSRIASNTGGDRHIICCVVLRARMRLAPSKNKRRLRLNKFVKKEAASASSTQQLRLAFHGSVIVDSRRVLLPQQYLKCFLEPSMRAALYVIATTGLVLTVTSWTLLLLHSEYVLAPAIGAFVSSLLFVLITVSLAQRDILRLLVRKFDALFSTFQATALALCLLDMLQLQISSSLAVVTWWLWFLWVVMLDALTPCVARQLRLRKLALPAIILVLLIAGICAVDIVLGDDKLFKSRLLFSLSLPRLGTFHEYTDTLAVQRVVTIIGWNARLVFELAFGDPNQLIFICKGVEYTSPFLTFSEPIPQEQQIKAKGTVSTGGWRWKLLRPIGVAPKVMIQPEMVPNGVNLAASSTTGTR
ncbi:hypothetical protein PC111_g7634 [Phytophthora cactorum]|nr:hypothetical protein PC111_g7634 [Phytophthora cactorum]